MNKLFLAVDAETSAFTNGYAGADLHGGHPFNPAGAGPPPDYSLASHGGHLRIWLARFSGSSSVRIWIFNGIPVIVTSSPIVGYPYHVCSSLVPSVLLYSESGIPFHSTLSAFLECDTLHSVEWNACCNMHSIPWSECVWTHSRHIPVFEFSRFKRIGE